MLKAQLVEDRSIPAGAGEPLGFIRLSLLRKVYPRGCGGTVYHLGPSYRPQGLSPRVRGNLDVSPQRYTQDGSIPAGAGEPSAIMRPPSRTAVYPRGCGGTTFGLPHACKLRGLSPRVRGNRPSRLSRCWPLRSIPAGAGEPERGFIFWSVDKVYPRGCGGTAQSITGSYRAQGLSPRVRGNLSNSYSATPDIRSISAGAGGT